MVMRIKHLLVVGVLLAMSSTSFAYTPTMCYLPKGILMTMMNMSAFKIFLRVRRDNKWGLVDGTDERIKYLTEIKYDEIERPQSYYAVVGQQKRYGLVDDTGKEILPIKYAKIFMLPGGFGKDGVIKVANTVNNYEYGDFNYVNKSGKLISSITYEDAISFSEGLAAVKKNGKWGFIDNTGKTVIALQYEDALPFSEGLATVKQNGKWGFIDKTGKTVLGFNYESARNFYNNLAPVQLKSGFFSKKAKWGFIDKTGKTVIAFNYDDAMFYGGYPQVKQGDDWIFYDTDGSKRLDEDPNFCCYGPMISGRPDRD